ncbi:MAG: quinone-dependent dihydroorotate dehydrogenase [Azospirillaceae bacterium]
MIDLFPLARPLLHALPPELAHGLTLRAMRAGLAPVERRPDDPVLACQVWGRSFGNPLGIAAGFDKNAEVVAPLLRLGFGFVEIGSVTPRPQPGNAGRRLWRWRERRALINRLGFNNKGAEVVAANLARLRQHTLGGPVGVNLGRNRDSRQAGADYVAGVGLLGPQADYIVVNVSSPNTPGLRALQAAEALGPILSTVLEARHSAGLDCPVVVKIAPDLDAGPLAATVTAILDGGADGIAVSNTTVGRPPDLPRHLAGCEGGLSGPPLFALATETLRRVAIQVAGRVPLIGIGGVASGADAYAKIRAGASLVQLYTALAYRGPRLVGEIKRDLARLLKADGFGRVGEAVGADLPQ